MKRKEVNKETLDPKVVALFTEQNEKFLAWRESSETERKLPIIGKGTFSGICYSENKDPVFHEWTKHIDTKS